MPAKVYTVDFSRVDTIEQHASGVRRDSIVRPHKPVGEDGKLLTPKQIRARARRKMKRHEYMSDEEMEYLYQKPIEEWDLEELAHGRPRPFHGPKPKWINIQVHERAMELYQAAIRTGMRGSTVTALETMQDLITNNDVDEKGKPVVPPSVKADLSKFLLEHSVGKPTQRVESDVSVKLQGILGAVMVNPSQVQQGYSPAHFPGITMALATADKDEDEDDEFGGE